MRHLILPMLVATFAAAPQARAQGLEDFSRFSRAIGREVLVVDQSGVVRKGIVVAATADQVTLRVGAGLESLPRTTVSSAERTRDRNSDGAIKGAVFAAITGLLAVRAYPPGSDRAGMLTMHVVTYSGIGWLLDAMHTNREPLYRAPASGAPSLTISWRF